MTLTRGVIATYDNGKLFLFYATFERKNKVKFVTSKKQLDSTHSHFTARVQQSDMTSSSYLTNLCFFFIYKKKKKKLDTSLISHSVISLGVDDTVQYSTYSSFF